MLGVAALQNEVQLLDDTPEMSIPFYPLIASRAGTYLLTHAHLIHTILRMIQLKIILLPHKKPKTYPPLQQGKQSKIRSSHCWMTSQLIASPSPGLSGYVHPEHRWMTTKFWQSITNNPNYFLHTQDTPKQPHPPWTEFLFCVIPSIFENLTDLILTTIPYGQYSIIPHYDWGTRGITGHALLFGKREKRRLTAVYWSKLWIILFPAGEG